MIKISEKTRDYILRKGGNVHVLHSHETVNCCIPANLSPSVRLGKPPYVKDYVLTIMDGINVYLPNDFHTPNHLIIGLGEFLGMKSLRIEGWRLM